MRSILLAGALIAVVGLAAAQGGSGSATSTASAASTTSVTSTSTSATSQLSSGGSSSFSSNSSSGTASSSSSSGVYDPFPDRHLLCYSDFAGTLWRIEIMPQLHNFTVVSKVTSNTTVSTQYALLTGPHPESWPEGVTFARAMQQQGFFPLTDPIEFALWDRDPFTRIDFMWFNATTTEFGFPLPEVAFFSSILCPDWVNCYANQTDGIFGAHCYFDNETCCGNGTAFIPTCVSNDNGDQCCAVDQGAAACHANQTYCGGLFASFASCCDENSTCCTASNASNGISSCCPEGSTCCQGSFFGLCCGAGETCDAENNLCVVPGESLPGITPFTLPTFPQESVTSSAAAASAPAEVTDAPTAAAASSTIDVVSNTTAAPTAASLMSVNAILTLSGSGWENVQNGIGGIQWAALQPALRNDLANALGVDFANVTINSLVATQNSLVVNYSVLVASGDANQVTMQAAQLSSSPLNLPATSAVYATANPGSGNITVVSSGATSAPANSAAVPPQLQLLGVAVLALAAVLLM